MTETKMIRLSYGEGETGWAEDLGDGRIKLANCPLNPDLRIGDICSTRPEGDSDYPDWLVVDEVLERTYPHSAIIRYPETKHWYLIRGGSLIAGWRCEGGIGPKDGNPGFCTMNYKGDEDELEEFLEKLYIKDQVTVNRYDEDEITEEETP